MGTMPREALDSRRLLRELPWQGDCLEERGGRHMSVKSVTTAAIATLLTVGCGYSIKTATDYDRTVHFSNYHTFFMMKGNSSGNPFLDERAASDVKAALTGKGWAEVPEGQGRAVVVVHAATKTKHSYQTFYDGWGGGWRWHWGGPGSSTTLEQDYKVGTVVVDIFDADTRQAIWRGSATDALSDNQKDNTEATQAAIVKMFNNFPPES
jgi:hypothetical protein